MHESLAPILRHCIPVDSQPKNGWYVEQLGKRESERLGNKRGKNDVVYYVYMWHGLP